MASAIPGRLFQALLVICAIAGSATTAEARTSGTGAIQLVRIVGGPDEDLRLELREALRTQLWEHGFPHATVDVRGAELPELDPSNREALRMWRRLGRERSAETIALLECIIEGNDVSLGLWTIDVASGKDYSEQLRSKRSAAAATVAQLVERAADGIAVEPPAIDRPPMTKEERLYRSGKRRRNVGAGLLGVVVPIVGIPTVFGLVRANQASEEDQEITTVSFSLAPVFLVFGGVVTIGCAVTGTVLVIVGVRRMNRYRPYVDEDARLGARPRFAGLSPLLDEHGRPSGLGLQLTF